MRFLEYSGLKPGNLSRAIAKVRGAIERGDLRSADVKKLQVDGYYRAKLDTTNRLLLQFLEHEGERACLALEVIRNHDYDKSRFLRGASVSEDKILLEPPAELQTVMARNVRYLHPERPRLQFLDKPISFDDAQDAVLRARTPILLVGSAGSGKTAVALSRLREAPGEVAYITQSPYLAEATRGVYHAHGFEREDQEITFLSQRELFESIAVPDGRPLTFGDFRGWFSRMRQTCKFADAHQVFEEFRGVLSSRPAGPLSRDEYLGLGVRQSIFATAEREVVFELFEKYRVWLGESDLFEPTLLSAAYLPKASARFDFVVVDEVQDLTSVELTLVLKTLRVPGNLVLCGDSNQIVHPNFFSWSSVKTLFWKDDSLDASSGLSVIDVNYRNARSVTEFANALLKIKHARFGSVDRESNQLVRPVAAQQGSVVGLPDKSHLLHELDQKTRRSTRFAVLVLRDEDKTAAKAKFHTPLVFSIHEAKGLEYENVILYGMISGARAQYAAVCEGVTRDALDATELAYRRGRDKTDKALEIYKFFINALYVAVTRATGHVYLVESDRKHPLLSLLSVAFSENSSGISSSESSLDEWQREARKLELQGKQEQADAIRNDLLRTTPVPWTPIDRTEYLRASEELFDRKRSDPLLEKKLFEQALFHDDQNLYQRIQDACAHERSADIDQRRLRVRNSALKHYRRHESGRVLELVDRHGVDHRSEYNVTPLMAAAFAGNGTLIRTLLDRGASLTTVDHFGRMPMHYGLMVVTENPVACTQSWDLLAPGTLDLQLGGQLVKLPRHQGEFLVFTATVFALSELHRNNRRGLARGRGVTAAHLERLIGEFPSVFAPDFRKKRTYISSLLSKNEMDSPSPYSRRFLLRERTGNYLLRPDLQLRVTGADGRVDWRPWRELFGIDLHERNQLASGMPTPSWRWEKARREAEAAALRGRPATRTSYGSSAYATSPGLPRAVWRSTSRKKRRR